MSSNQFILTAAVLFLAVFALHAMRLLFSWEAVIGRWPVPFWMSWIALVITGYMIYTGFKLAGRR